MRKPRVVPQNLTVLGGIVAKRGEVDMYAIDDGKRDIPSHLRGDAAFAITALYRVLEEGRFRYTIRIPANDVLMAHISNLLTRLVGRPSYKPKVFYESF